VCAGHTDTCLRTHWLTGLHTAVPRSLLHALPCAGRPAPQLQQTTPLLQAPWRRLCCFAAAASTVASRPAAPPPRPDRRVCASSCGRPTAAAPLWVSRHSRQRAPSSRAAHTWPRSGTSCRLPTTYLRSGRQRAHAQAASVAGLARARVCTGGGGGGGGAAAGRPPAAPPAGRCRHAAERSHRLRTTLTARRASALTVWLSCRS
jgi:hypothetical protein